MNSSPFVYRDGWLYVEDISLAELAAAAKTPLYVYSQQEITRRAAAYHHALTNLTPQGQVCYAIKANGTLALLRLLADMGLGADVTSGGELFLALKAGFAPANIVFSGVGKQRDEIALALQQGIRALHVESAQELQLVGLIAAAQQKVASVTLRLNPNVPAATHPYISTGSKAHKFGLSADDILPLIPFIQQHPWLKLSGLAVHIGSQITQLDPFARAVQVLLRLAQTIKEQAIPIAYLDVGGGLGIDYTIIDAEAAAASPTISEWVQTVAQPVIQAGYGVLMEPGRSIVGPAGILLTQVLFTKQQGEQSFIITDAGMTELIRPALYQAHHPLLPVRVATGDLVLADVVGPVCETGDTLARSRPLPPLQPGDYLAFLQAGAYGFAMSSNYNGRLRPAEVLVNGSDWRTIRQRQTVEDLLTGQ
ncbi:MAG: diaminopimelate decarboxylase [Chloroflexi bacterium]|nr:diaminopimelate decarboxylase [Chloroflexota bacterium]MBP8056496.1 diaminopimelate decarboxylase [Chloroflexota bacterium]